jgi:hypothetical protein
MIIERKDNAVTNEGIEKAQLTISNKETKYLSNKMGLKNKLKEWLKKTKRKSKDK